MVQVYNRSALLTCVDGHWMQDGLTAVVLTCDGLGGWDVQATCEGAALINLVSKYNHGLSGQLLFSMANAFLSGKFLFKRCTNFIN